MPVTRRKAKEKDARPPAIETSDADPLSGPETRESQLSAPQSIKSEAFMKTEGSVHTEASSKTETSSKTEASSKTKASSKTEDPVTTEASGESKAPMKMEKTSSPATANASGKPSSLLASTLKSGEAPKLPSTGGGCGRSAAAVSASASTAACETPRSSTAVAIEQQHEEERDVEDTETESNKGSVAEEVDLDNALSNALKATRRGRDAPPVTDVPEKARAAPVAAVAGRDASGPGVGVNASGFEVGAGVKGEDWAGQSEGMFRKRVSEELKDMLRHCGGRCEMSSIAAVFKRHHHRVLNLYGKKLRGLLTTGSGLYGIGLYGEGPDGEIRLEDNRVLRDSNGVLGSDLDGAGGRSGTQPLTRTFVNQNAFRNVDSPPRASSPEERGNSYDRADHNSFGGAGHSSRSAAAQSTLAPLGSRTNLGYVSSLADAATARSSKDREAWVGRGQSRSRSPRHQRRHSWDREASGGARNGRRLPPSGVSRSPSEGRRFSRMAGRVTPHRRSSSLRRRARSPSPRNQARHSRGFSRHSNRGPPSRGNSPRRNSPSRRRSHSRSLRKTSTHRRGSPPRKTNPRRRSMSRSNSSLGRSPLRSDSRQHSADRGRRRPSRLNDKDEPSESRGRNGNSRPSTGRDRDGSSRAVSSRKLAGKRSDDGAGDEGAMRTGRGALQGAPNKAPPPSYRSVSPAANYASPVVYSSEALYGVPREARRGTENGRSAVGGRVAGRHIMDPVIPLALGGTPAPLSGGEGRHMMDPVIPVALGGAPVPSIAALPGKRRLVETAVGGGGGFPSHDDNPRKRFHAAAEPAGSGDGYPVGNGRMLAGNWVGGDGGGSSQVGGLAGPPLALRPASALLPPPSSLRPVPLPNGRVQGARLMIKGTHPAVPERRIHALVSAFGVVGKIEVLEGFVFVHMKSLEEASRAVAGLNGDLVPHVSPQASERSGAPLPALAASIWREEQYQSLMSRENMRIYADSMRRASTWYEKQTKSGFNDTLGKRMPCRFFALGRGCIFGSNCGFSHDLLSPHPRAATSIHGGASVPSFPLLLSKPQPMLPGGMQLPYMRKMVPVLAEDGQSPTLTFVHKDEIHRRTGPGAQGTPMPDRTGAYNGVGVATPWQPEHGTGGVTEAGRVSPHPGEGSGRAMEHQPPKGGGGPSRPLHNSESLRDGPGRIRTSASPTAKTGSSTRRSGYRYSSDRREGEGRSGESSGHSDRGESRRDRDDRGSGGIKSPRRVQRGSSRTRQRSNTRGSSRVSSHGARGRRGGSPSSRHENKRGRHSTSRRSSPHRSSGGFEKSGGKLSRSTREAGRRRGRGNSGSRRSKSQEGSAYRTRKHSLDGERRQRRDSRSTSRARRHRDDSGGRNGRPAANDERAHRRRRSRDSTSPVVKGRRYESDHVDSDLDGRRTKRGRNERESDRGRGTDRVRRENMDDERDSFLGRGGGSGRRENDNVSHGWVSVADNPGAFSRDGQRRNVGGSPLRGMGSNVSGGVPRHNERYNADRSMSPHGSAEWNNDMDGGFMHPEVRPPRPVKTQFTVTARLGSRPGSLQPPPPVSAPTPAAASRPTTKFSITMPPSLTGALGQTSPSGGVRRGGRPARGRGRGGRFDSRRDTTSRRPPRGFQGDDGEF